VPPDDTAQTRLRLRRARAALSETTLARNSEAIHRHALRCLRLLRPRTLAGYFGIRGEIDITPLLSLQAQSGVRIAMPILERHRPGAMQFRRWSPGQDLCRNGYGIPEPCPDAPRVWRREIDTVLLPLVGFDEHGHRLGMGGGYYDRYFSRCRFSRQRRPYLVGIAHDFQQVPELEKNPWDVPLDAVITESGWRRFPRSLPDPRAAR
jgi:5-formyltetrahydrofolate cyclo-ligase